ncbi:ACT domain-containing protein [Clostridium senegalense]|uniref:ACT domain-containing protein n=1 Tax=Clostridium senegalense TaxID=1465809 RepID=UPI000287BA93|nr:ACT domain-containing protein [Clostridium senegalense]MBU5226369.1 ACT domain-containing protein [Clostridium senegalense]
MENNYFVVDGEVLPEIFSKVVEVKQLLYKGHVKDITEGVKVVGISRSAYYKYRDKVFLMTEDVKGQKATISILASHEYGALSEILETIVKFKGNVITINQDIPINRAANITITLDILNLEGDIEELIAEMQLLSKVIKINLIAIE